jgi:hypothetical protein
MNALGLRTTAANDNLAGIRTIPGWNAFSEFAHTRSLPSDLCRSNGSKFL